MVEILSNVRRRVDFCNCVCVILCVFVSVSVFFYETLIVLHKRLNVAPPPVPVGPVRKYGKIISRNGWQAERRTNWVVSMASLRSGDKRFGGEELFK